MRIAEYIEAWGHPKVRGTHRKTFEITKHHRLTERGDCIIATRASKGAADLSGEFKKLSRADTAVITFTIDVDGVREVAKGLGSETLVHTHPSDLVARKSSYTCERTFMIKADKSAFDLSRDLIRLLQDPRQKVEIVLEIQT